MTNQLAGLRRVNLNLIPVLAALLRCESVGAAAIAIGLSQSATSTCLAQLRLVLGDPLLVKEGRRMRLTPRAKALIVPVETLCGQLQEVLSARAFDPASTSRTFVIATPDYVAFLLADQFQHAIQHEAPNLRVQFTDVPVDLGERMASGDIDVAIVATERLVWRGYRSGQTVQERFVLVTRRGHPLSEAKSITLASIKKYPRIGWRAGIRLPAAATQHWTADAHDPSIWMQQYALLPLLAAESDLVALAPESIAKRLSRHVPLAIFAAPFQGPGIKVSVIWSEVQEADPAHAWFRERAGEMLKAVHARRRGQRS